MIDEDQDDDEAQEIPLPNVKSTILAKVIEYCKHYKEDAMSEIEKVNKVFSASIFVCILITNPFRSY